MKIVTTLSVNEKKQEQLREMFENDEFFFFSNMKEASDDIVDGEVLLTYGSDLTTEIINEAKKLKWIMVMSAGVDRLPFEAIKKRNIIVTNVRGIHSIPMAEYTLGMILQVAKHMKQAINQEKNSEWKRLSMNELYEKNILIIGVGAIGSRIAKLCKAFDMRTYGINTSGRMVEYIDEVGAIDLLEGFLPKADFIVSVLPSTPETRNFLTKEHFQLMKDSAVFINIGRGDLIKDSLMLEIMEEKLISHAVLDVFENEPLPSEHPFWKMENVTITPHIASITSKYLPRAFEIFESNLYTYKKDVNEMKNLINVDRGY